MLEKNVSEITYQDVEDFCKKGLPESAWLDYKESFDGKSANKQVAKIVSAMANTHGGWILVGVRQGERDAQGRGLPGDLVGMLANPSPAEQIKQICLDGIYPPVVPEMASCHLPVDQERVVIVIRVFESDSTPHQTSDGRVYVRRGDISHIEADGKTATVADIEALIDRRARAVATKQRLLSRARSRASCNAELPALTTYCIPSYPNAPICDLNLITDSATYSRKLFTFSQSKSLQTAHESILSRFNRSTIEEEVDNFTAFEFNVFGLVLLHSTVLAARHTGGSYLINGPICMSLLYSTIQAAEVLYTRADYTGLVEVGLILACEGSVARLSSLEYVKPNEICDRQLPIIRSALRHNIRGKDFLVDVFREFLWSAGYGPRALTDSLPESWYDAIVKDLPS